MKPIGIQLGDVDAERVRRSHHDAITTLQTQVAKISEPEGVLLGAGRIKADGAALGGLEICRDLRSMTRIAIEFYWVNAGSGTARQLHLDFNAGADTGDGSERSATAGFTERDAGLLEETSAEVTYGRADLLLTRPQLLIGVSVSADSPYAGANVFVKNIASAWDVAGAIKSLTVRTTTLAGTRTAYLGIGSWFEVRGRK